MSLCLDWGTRAGAGRIRMVYKRMRSPTSKQTLTHISVSSAQKLEICGLSFCLSFRPRELSLSLTISLLAMTNESRAGLLLVDVVLSAL